MKNLTVKDESARFRRLLMETILLPAFLISLAAALLVWLTVYLFGAIYWTQHSTRVIAKISECRALTLDFETSKRGYLFNADSIFLTTHTVAAARLIPALNELRMRVCDDPVQVARSVELKHSALGLLTSGEEQMRNRAQGTAVDESRVLADKATMDSLRSQFDIMQQSEEKLSAKRFERLHRAKLILIWLGSGLVLVLAGLISLAVRQQFSRLASYYREALTNLQLKTYELQEQKEWFRVTLLSIGEAVIVTDVGGRVVFMNPEAERMTEWSSVDAIRRPLADVFHIVNEETRAHLDNQVERVLRDGRSSAAHLPTLLISRQENREWPIQETASPIMDATGKLRGVVIIFHDTTGPRQEQKTLRDQATLLEETVRERTESLRASVRQLESFCYTVSHDLRSPLRAMQGYAELVLNEHGDSLNKDVSHYVSKIQRAAERLNVLISDLLAYTRTTGLKSPFEVETLGTRLHEIDKPDAAETAAKVALSESPAPIDR